MLKNGWSPKYFAGLKLWLASDACATDVAPVYAPVPGMAVWLKADDIAGNDGDAIGTWSDSSGNGNDVAQATGGNKPLLKKAGNGLNGRNVLRFDGTNDYMRGTFNPGSTGMTVFYVARTGGTISNYGTIVGSGNPGDNPTTGIRWGFACGSAVDGFGAGWAGVTADVELGNVTGININTPFFARYKYDKVNWEMDGVNTTTKPDTTFPGGTFQLHVGTEFVLAGNASLMFDGDIAEIIIYTTALSGGDCDIVKNYLRQKWGMDTVKVTSWTDQSGNANDFAQATGANQPLLRLDDLNGHAGVFIAGPDKYLTSSFAPAAGARTIVAVTKIANLISTGYCYPYTTKNGSTYDYWMQFNARVAWYSDALSFNKSGAGSTMGPGSSADPQNTNVQRTIISYDGGSNTLAASYVFLKDAATQVLGNGAPDFAGFNTLGSTAIGSYDGNADATAMGFHFYELMEFNRQLSVVELKAIDQYLKNKYGLA